MNEHGIKSTLAEIGIATCFKNSGGWVGCACPFAPYLHMKGKDRKASFFVKIRDDGPSGYHCFTCKEKGTLHGMVAKLEHLSGRDFGDLKTRINLGEITDDFGEWQESRPVDEHLMAEPLDEREVDLIFPHAYLNDEAMTYLNRRCIGINVAKRLDLRYDSYQQRILFPVRDDAGVLYGLTGRSIKRELAEWEPKVRVYAGLQKEWFLLGEEHVNPTLRWNVVVEGQFDLAHLHQIGVPKIANVVATMGSVMSVGQARRLIEHGQAVLLLYDNDMAGYQGVHGTKTKDGHHANGAKHKLAGFVPVYEPVYPRSKREPENLTLVEVQRMLHKTAKPV